MRHPLPNTLTELGHTEDGATSVEYALLVVFIATVVVASVGILGTTVLGLFTTGTTLFGSGS